MTLIRWAPPLDPTDVDWITWADELPLCRALGIVCIALDSVSGEFVIERTPLVANPNGGVNGGLLVAIADQALGILAMRGAPPGCTTATASLHTQFLAPAYAPLRQRARVLGGGRRLRFIEVTVLDREGRTCATSQGTMTILGSSDAQ